MATGARTKGSSVIGSVKAEAKKTAAANAKASYSQSTAGKAAITPSIARRPFSFSAFSL